MEAAARGQASGVFVDRIADLDVHLCGDYLQYLEDVVRGAEVEFLKMAAHWADLHHPDSEHALTFNRGAEKAIRVGGEGTPEVLHYCVAEFGALRKVTPGQGQEWLADALDVRHRLPLLWARAMARGADVWKVRRIAVATRHLSFKAAGSVDRRLENVVGLKGSWAAIEKILTGAIIDADPDLAEQQAESNRNTATVRRLREPVGTGMGSMFLRGRIGDILALDGLINRIADCLKSRGDERLKDERRAAAIPFLANPARALELLAAHADDPDPGPETLFDDWPIDDHHSQSRTTRNETADEHSPFDKLRERGETLWDKESPPEPVDQQSEPEDQVSLHELILKPPPIDPKRLQPVVNLYVHLAAESLQPARNGADVGVARWAGHGQHGPGVPRRNAVHDQGPPGSST